MDYSMDYAEEIGNLFRSIHKTYQQYILSQVACHNLTVPQLMVLHELFHHPEVTLTELSERVGLAKSTVCGIIDRLESHGAVKRVRVSEDRRIVRISLTDEVAAEQEKLDVIRKNYLGELFKNTDASELEIILVGFKQLDNLMRKFQKDDKKPT